MVQGYMGILGARPVAAAQAWLTIACTLTIWK
jgi:hypothetical protein